MSQLQSDRPGDYLAAVFGLVAMAMGIAAAVAALLAPHISGWFMNTALSGPTGWGWGLIVCIILLTVPLIVGMEKMTPPTLFRFFLFHAAWFGLAAAIFFGTLAYHDPAPGLASIAAGYGALAIACRRQWPKSWPAAAAIVALGAAVVIGVAWLGGAASGTLILAAVLAAFGSLAAATDWRATNDFPAFVSGSPLEGRERLGGAILQYLAIINVFQLIATAATGGNRRGRRA